MLAADLPLHDVSARMIRLDHADTNDKLTLHVHSTSSDIHGVS
jgi:hypothetical protein